MKASMTTRGRRRKRTISVRIIISEFPAPAWRPKTSSGPGRGSGGSTISIRSPSSEMAAVEITRSQPRRSA